MGGLYETNGDAAGSPSTVVIGVCTYERPAMLSRLLDALDRQTYLKSGAVRSIVVVDNSPLGSAASTVEKFAARSTIPVRFIRLEERGLCKARNAILQDVSGNAEFLAFVDDDEIPEPDWLEALVACREQTLAGVVTGPVRPVFSSDTPDWLRSGGFLELQEHPDRALLTEAISGNALLHLPSINAVGLQFDERYNRTGGEDQLFFRQAVAAGVDIRYAADAVAYEAVPVERTRFRYLLQRELRKGNTLGLLAHDHSSLGESMSYRAMAAAKWAFTGAGLSVLGTLTGHGVRLRKGVLRLTRAVGMIGGIAGWRYRAY